MPSEAPADAVRGCGPLHHQRADVRKLSRQMAMLPPTLSSHRGGRGNPFLCRSTPSAVTTSARTAQTRAPGDKPAGAMAFPSALDGDVRGHPLRCRAGA